MGLKDYREFKRKQEILSAFIDIAGVNIGELVSTIKEFRDEINELKAQNASLKEELQALKNNVFSYNDKSDKKEQEILRRIQNGEIATPAQMLELFKDDDKGDLYPNGR